MGTLSPCITFSERKACHKLHFALLRLCMCYPTRTTCATIMLVLLRATVAILYEAIPLLQLKNCGIAYFSSLKAMLEGIPLASTQRPAIICPRASLCLGSVACLRRKSYDPDSAPSLLSPSLHCPQYPSPTAHCAAAEGSSTVAHLAWVTQASCCWA